MTLAELNIENWRKPHSSFIEDRLANREARIASGKSISDIGIERWLETEFIPLRGGANNFTVELDTTGPTSPTFSINSGAATTTSTSATAHFGTADSSTTGYQIKIWGAGINESGNANIQNDEGDSSWIAYSASQAITLTSGDGSKAVSAKIRDDVWNETTELTDTITLDTTLPTVNITVGPDVTKVSKISGKRTISFSFVPDSDLDEYKVKVVPATGSAHSAGTLIPETNSTNMSDGPGSTVASGATVASTIDGRDIETASAGDGNKIIKVFVKDEAGNWSV